MTPGFVALSHIDLLFTKQVEWNLIETMLPEMLRVAFSIGAGRIRPSSQTPGVPGALDG